MPEKPRVCIFTETYYPVIGGGETQARLLAESLVKMGHKVIVLTRRTDPGLAKTERIGEVDVYRLPPIGQQHLKKWGLLISAVPLLFRLRQQYDVILVSGFRVIGIGAVIVSKILKKVCLLKADSNGEMSGEFFRGGLEKTGLKANSFLFKVFLRMRNKFLRIADGFVAISGQIAEEFSAMGIQPPTKIHLIPNSVDIQVFSPIPTQEKIALRTKLG
jgi:glycosyltransferase involved in cell wall biosynthesis